MTERSSPARPWTQRPHIHFAPRRNWMNDPNGLVCHDGTYHLFFQYNPHEPVHGHMSWGHATSSDLIGWHEEPVAIRHSDHQQIYSGSVVVDHDNTSGLATGGAPVLVAVYTLAPYDRRQPQVQALAYSNDGGSTWRQYAGNPVLDRSSRHFRDPKVFWYDGPAGSYWVMVAVEAKERRVLFYRSDDLIRWEYLSDYGPAGAVSGVWECPDMFPLALDGNEATIRWVLVISVNPGALAGGSGTQYVVGDFDGVRFVPDEPAPPSKAESAFQFQGREELESLDWLDYGRDCYAGVTYSGTSDRVLIAWMSNWEYARDFPTAPWRGTMTLPRRLELVTRGGRARLRQTPVVTAGVVVEELGAHSGPTAVTMSTPLPPAARIDLRAHVPEGGTLQLRLCHGADGADGVVVLWRDGRVVVDRSAARADFGSAFGGMSEAKVGVGAVEASIWLDAGSIELVTAAGTCTMTELHFASGSGLTVESTGAARLDQLAVSDLTA